MHRVLEEEEVTALPGPQALQAEVWPVAALALPAGHKVHGLWPVWS